MLRFALTFLACLVAGALPAIVPVALGRSPAPIATDAPKVDGPKPVAYRCASERTFSVVFKAGKEADLVMGTKTYTLKQERAAAGFRYTDGTLTLIGKGQEATLEGTPGPVGALSHCVAQERF